MFTPGESEYWSKYGLKISRGGKTQGNRSAHSPDNSFPAEGFMENAYECALENKVKAIRESQLHANVF